jgi:hypothetical protein
MKKTKHCKRCDTTKSLKAFSKQSSNKDGLQYTCKECCNEIRKVYIQRIGRDVINAKKKQSRCNNLEHYREVEKAWVINNRDKVKEISRKSKLKNKVRNNSRTIERHKERMMSDELYKCKEITRCTLKQSFYKMGFTKDSNTALIIGIEWSEFKQHIGFKFDENMNWNNHGVYWNMDHIIPIKYATTPDEVIWLNHYTNFQPMEKHENQVVKRDNVFYDLEALDRVLKEWI